MKKGRKFSIFFFWSKDIAEWNKDHYKKNKKGEEEQGELVELKIFKFFWSKDFISQESPILADVDFYQK